jgi:hypothetical protein
LNLPSDSKSLSPVIIYWAFPVTAEPRTIKSFQLSWLRLLYRLYVVGVHGFRGSGVQGSILVPELHLGCVFIRKASALSGLIQYLGPNWQLFGKMSIFNEDFGSLMPSLSFTLNVEPPGPDLNLCCSIIQIHIWEPDSGRNMIL